MAQGGIEGSSRLWRRGHFFPGQSDFDFRAVFVGRRRCGCIDSLTRNSEVEEVGQARLNVAIFEVEMERDPSHPTIGMKLKIWRLEG